MAELNSEAEEPHVGQLLRQAFARFESELLVALPKFRGEPLRASHTHVLRYLDLEGGTRASLIAERAGLTRQAITQIVDELEELGVVTREADPEDGRAKRVVYTRAGRRAFARSRERIAEIEAAWRAEMGPARWRALNDALRIVSGH